MPQVEKLVYLIHFRRIGLSFRFPLPFSSPPLFTALSRSKVRDSAGGARAPPRRQLDISQQVSNRIPSTTSDLGVGKKICDLTDLQQLSKSEIPVTSDPGHVRPYQPSAEANLHALDLRLKIHFDIVLMCVCTSSVLTKFFTRKRRCNNGQLLDLPGKAAGNNTSGVFDGLEDRPLLAFELSSGVVRKSYYCDKMKKFRVQDPWCVNIHHKFSTSERRAHPLSETKDCRRRMLPFVLDMCKTEKSRAPPGSLQQQGNDPIEPAVIKKCPQLLDFVSV